MTTNTNLTSQSPYVAKFHEALKAHPKIEPCSLACMVYMEFISQIQVPPRYWISELLGIYLTDPKKLNLRQIKILIEVGALDSEGKNTNQYKPAYCCYSDSIGGWKIRQDLGIGEIIDTANEIDEITHRQMIAEFNKKYGWTYEDKELTRLLEERARLPKIEPNVDLDEEEQVF